MRSMTAYVALFRGINVGGRNALPMKELLAALEDVGCRGARTYIQSGNAVFTHHEADASRLSRRIGLEIEKRRGFVPHVLLLDVDAVETAIARNPFREAEGDPRALHLGFLSSTPANPDLKALDRLKRDSERFRLVGNVFYLHAPEGVGRSRLAAAAEKLLGVPMTDRNWRTVCRIREMVKRD